MTSYRESKISTIHLLMIAVALILFGYVIHGVLETNTAFAKNKVKYEVVSYIPSLPHEKKPMEWEQAILDNYSNQGYELVQIQIDEKYFIFKKNVN